MTFFAIQGVTEDGRRFRPSDWADRLASRLAGFGSDRRLRFSPELRPMMLDGRKGLVVSGRLRERCPDLWREVMGFAERNGLRVCRGEERPEGVALSC